MKNAAARLCILLAALTVFTPPAHGAAVKALNNMGDSIVALECIMPDGSAKRVMGLVPHGQSSFANLDGCDRLVMRWGSLVTQFFIEEPVLERQTLTFSFNSLDAGGAQRHPVLSIEELSGEKVIPGGLPFNVLIRSLEDGMTAQKLDELLPPAGRPLRDPKKYAVALAESSWRILYDSLEFDIEKDNSELLRSLTIESDYISPVVLMALAHLQKIGADPYLARTDSEILPLRADAVSDTGQASVSTDNFETDTFHKRWNAVDTVLLDIATGARASKGIVFIFTTEKIRYEFNLNFATAMASLKIVRI